jgi:hypothetical protein
MGKPTPAQGNYTFAAV